MLPGPLRTTRLHSRVPMLALAFVLAAAAPAAFAQESASYVMERVTISSTASMASSAGYEMSVTFGQEGPSGSIAVCEGGTLQGAGFWSIYGDTPVPIVLDVLQNGGDPEVVDLSWTGSAGLFEIFRSDMADTVALPASSVLTTSACAISDDPPVGDIFYYIVESPGS